MKTPSAYPLQWPPGWPKTEFRHKSAFKTDTGAALRNLNRELNLMGAKSIVLSSNYTLGVENPKEPGVCAYFEWDGLQLAIPCDRWQRICDNIQAISLTVEAMRGMQRWGAKHMIRAMFTGFKALKAPESVEWWTVLQVLQTDRPELVKEAYRRLANQHHPDKGGDPEVFMRVQRAYEVWSETQK
jgi:hypothetical protein